MKITICPYLKFNDSKCREAMGFYKTIFGGKVEFMTIGEMPEMAKEMPADKHKLIMHSELVSGEITFYGADMMRDKAVIGDNVGVAIQCSSEKELRDMFKKLSEGGDVFMEPEEVSWGAIYGMTTDKYGVEWMLNFQKTSMKK